MSSLLRYVGVGVSIAAVACAQGSGVDSAFGGAGGLDAGMGGDHATASSSKASSSSSSSSVASSSASSSSSSGSGGAGGGTTCFDASNDCAASIEIQAIAGDDNSDTRTETGTTAQWFKLLVQESVSSPFSYPSLSYTATLASPSGSNFDLYVYNGDSSSTNCTTFPVKAQGDPDAVSDGWSDSPGSDDSRWINLEVRYVSGTDCSGTWTLTVQGNTQ